MQTLTDLKERTQWAIDFIAEKTNLNNAEIGSAVGSKPDTVRKYRSGLATPRLSFIQRFCDRFAVDFQWLSKGIGEPFPGQDPPLPAAADAPGTEAGGAAAPEASSAPAVSRSDSETSGRAASEPADGPMDASLLSAGPVAADGMDSEMSFQKLAVLAGIKIDNEWILNLSEKFGIESWKIGLSIYQRRIDNALVQCVEDCGYEKEAWLVRPESKKSVPPKMSGGLTISQLLKITEEVLRSNTIHSTSLAMNIISLKELAKKTSSAPVLGARAINLPEKKRLDL